MYGISNLPVTNTTTYEANGYSNYTGNNALVVQQAQGEAVNISASVLGTFFNRGRWKAWVDWNYDGDFLDAGEEVYNVGGIVATTVGFGFEIPENQLPGKYRLRIRVNNSRINGTGEERFGFEYTPCDNFTVTTGSANISNYGETEDYFFEVVSNCSAKITTVVPGSDCNTPDGAEIVLSASTLQPVTEFRWYTTATGGTYVTSPPNASGTSTNWTTPPITETTTYYVTAFNGSCESTFRTEIIAEVLPTPEIEFNSESFDVCGEESTVEVSAVGDNEIVHLVKETFEDGTLGVFTNQRISTNTTPAPMDFINRTSVYRPIGPTYRSWRPAISSGFGDTKFVFSNSDTNQGIVERALQAPLSINTEGLESLVLTFRMYFSRYNPGATLPDGEYAAVEISTDNGTTWTELERFIVDVGRPARFERKTYNLDAYLNQTQLTFRLRMYSNPGGPGWFSTGLAVDGIELYGGKPLEPVFDWESNYPIGVYEDPEGTIPYDGDPISTVYFKPTDDQIILYNAWDVTATAELENGCNASGEFVLNNSSKIWDSTTATNWATLNWKPGTAVPTADNCVVIHTPIVIPSEIHALAKNIKVETGGNLQIQTGGSLTLTDYLVNELTAEDFVVENDANLIQVNPGAANSGEITLRREATVPSNQYNYWASPVVGQDLYALYPDIPNNRVMTYNTSTDYFNIVQAGTLSGFGVGYSIKGPTSNYPLNPDGTTDVVAEFIGVPQNEGLFANENSILLSNENNAFNLIGNPFPSNFNLQALYNSNGNDLAIDGNFYFWDNTNNLIYVQQGSGYQGDNYAVYNVSSGGIPADGGDLAKIPNGIVKPGQGFIVKALTGAPLIVDNAMRTKEIKLNVEDGDAPYYKNENEYSTDTHKRQDKFWLDLVTPGEIHVKILIGYFNLAENTLEKFDTKILNEAVSDDFYSISQEAYQLAIQGRKGPFGVEDVIPVGVKLFHSGQHRIQLDERMGIFVSQQTVYLKDNYLKIIHNLSESDYAFESTNGTFNDRFEIVFQNGNEDGPILTTAQSLEIRKVDHQIQILSTHEKIKEVEIFNLMQATLYKNNAVNANELKIPAKTFGKQIVVVNVLTESGEWISKKLILN